MGSLPILSSKKTVQVFKKFGWEIADKKEAHGIRGKTLKNK
jgi:predicted RNA binding protein YcfA (HicA-like mRNA interferase family)